MKHLYLTFFIVIQSFTTTWAQIENKVWQQTNDIFKTNYFIENKGQFTVLQKHLTNVKFAIQNNADEIYFSPNKVSFCLYKKVRNPNFKKEEKEEKDKVEEAILNPKYIKEPDWVDLEWLHTNADIKISTSEKSGHYFSYGDLEYKSYGYKTITFQNLYNHIDVQYKINPNCGFEYVLILHPGANLNDVQYTYTGNNPFKIKTIKNILNIKSKTQHIQELGLKAYYQNADTIEIKNKIENNIISFVSNQTLDTNKTIVIDPWIIYPEIDGYTQNGVFMPGPVNYAFDVDFDKQNNLLAYGGGDSYGVTSTINVPRIIKYTSTGTPLWTFMGYVPSIYWGSSPTGSNFLGTVGNFVVDKSSSNIYIGQGYRDSGATTIRLKPSGFYDNFKTFADTLFREIWELKINCNTGALFNMGGDIKTANNFGVVDTTTGTVTYNSFTGSFSNNGTGQDISCATFNPQGEMFVVIAGGDIYNTDNYIYKLNSTYTSYIWKSNDYFNTLSEAMNKNYVNIGISNGFNSLAANSNYLFFYDGQDIAIYNQATGNPLKYAIIPTSHVPIFNGGIYANDCNEIFLGGDTGMIYKYLYDPIPNSFTQIDSFVLPGMKKNQILDIAFNPINNLLYVTGKNLVATVDLHSNCQSLTTSYQLQTQVKCPDSLKVSIINADTSKSYTFVWTDSITKTQIQSITQPPGVITNTIGGIPMNATYIVSVIESNSPCRLLVNSIFLHPAPNNNFYDTICKGKTFTLPNGNIVSTSGVYNITLLSSTGCDSFVSVFLYVTPPPTLNIKDSICFGNNYTLPNGNIVNTAGTYTNTLISSKGCDSLIYISLYIKNKSSHLKTVSICSNKSYKLPTGISVSTAGIYTNMYVNYLGCDSLDSIKINILPISTHTLNASICSNQTYTLPNGTIVSNVGTYTNIFINSVGCDSIVTINLKVKAVNAKTINAIICKGNSYTLPNNTTVISQGIYTNTFTNSDGCDSIITTNLTVLEIQPTIKSAIICETQNYILPSGIVVNLPNTYIDTFKNLLGCDSIIKTNLQVVPLPKINLGNDTIICAGDTIQLDATSMNTTPSVTYLWNNGLTDSIIKVFNVGYYYVNVTDPPCPFVADTIKISNKYCLCKMYIPNAFTPNNDNVNDVFKPIFVCKNEITDYHLEIYNRIGNKVFESNSFNNAWNGDVGLLTGEVGTYFYLIRYKNPITLQYEIIKGDISLVK